MPPKARKAPPPDDDAGAPEWMVTFSDCMTLLLTFFVLLLSFSSFDDKVFPKMESAFSDGLSSIGLSRKPTQEAFELVPRIMYEKDPDVGSETPTVDGQYESNPQTDLDFMDFQDQKVFLVPSNKIFLGMGTRMSVDGRQMLTDLGTLLKAVPNRVVITEHPVQEGNTASEIGLTRAWIVAQFLANQEIERTRFSISSAGTTDIKTLRQSGIAASRSKANRVLEIVILERSTYN